jgi:tetratricopeptide (TPR) repeat protein
MSDRRLWRVVLTALLASPWLGQALAAEPAALPDSPAAAEEPAASSVMDDRLFYQLLIGELALTQGDAGTAYDWLLDAARRTKDEGLFRRSVDIAWQSRAGDQALAAARAWRIAKPESMDALRMQLQILMAMGRNGEVTEPLRSLLEQTAATERPALISALPRFLQRANDPKLVVTLMEDVFKPYLQHADTRIAARVALGRAWLEAKEPERALAFAQEASAQEPGAVGPALLALELMRDKPQAESTVQTYLKQPKAETALRMSYVRVLTAAQRYGDAISQLDAVVQAQPDVAAPYLSLGALHLELKHGKEGEAALLKYLDLAQRQPDTAAPPAEDDEDDNTPARADRGQIQAWLMLAQASEQRGDYKAAEAWLAKIEDPQRALDVQTRRASMLARQGRIAQAREIIRKLPERDEGDAKAKVMAEAAVLREAKRWKDAYEVLSGGSKRFGEDADMVYEQAMVAEKLERLDDMEKLLRRVIALKPDNAHAHNALGYSLADRKQRLPEARDLVKRALELAPGDPFITDSLGWVEYRMGNRDEALRLLNQAYAARPDTEIGAHLGEVLWALGQKEEARRVWREGKGRDGANDVLRETLARLRVDL